VDSRTRGNLAHGQAVPRLDVGFLGVDDLGSNRNTVCCKVVPTIAILVLNKRNKCCSVGIILDARNDTFDIATATFPVDHAILALISTAMMANNDATIVVASSLLWQCFQQALVGLACCQNFAVLDVALEPRGGRVRPHLTNCHKPLLQAR